MLTVWFELPEPLTGMRELVCEFMLDLHEWLEGRQAAPKLPVPRAEFVAWRRERLAELRSWLADRKLQ